MNNLKQNCHYTTSDRRKVLSENRSRFEFDNASGRDYCIVVVDNCQIEGNTSRCDYAAIIGEWEYYIELKGKDIKKAVGQIESTIKKLSVNYSAQKKKSFVISSRSPLSSSSIQVIRKRMRL